MGRRSLGQAGRRRGRGTHAHAGRDLDIDAARLLLAGAVAQAYIDLYRAYALEDIATRAQAQRENILEITRQRVAAGLDTRVELREAEGAVPQARLAITQAQSAQALARHAARRAERARRRRLCAASSGRNWHAGCRAAAAGRAADQSARAPART